MQSQKQKSKSNISEVDKLKAENNALKKEKLELSEKLEILEIRFRRVERDMDEVITAKHEITSQLTQVDSTLTVLQKDNDRISSLDTDISQARLEIANNTNSLKYRLDGLDKQRKEAHAISEDKQKKMESELAVAKKESSRYRQSVIDRLNGMDKQLKSYLDNNILKKLTSDIATLCQISSNDRNSFTARLNVIDQQIKSLSDNEGLKKLRNAVADLNKMSSSDRKTLNGRLNEIDQQVKILNNNDKQQTADIGVAELFQTLVKERLDTLDQQVKGMKVDVYQLSSESEKQQQEQQRLQSQMKHHEEQLNQQSPRTCTSTAETERQTERSSQKVPATWKECLKEYTTRLCQYILKQDIMSRSAFRLGFKYVHPLQGLFVPSGQRQKIEGYNIDFTNSFFMNRWTGEYVTPVKGKYKFGGCLVAPADVDEIRLYVCGDGHEERALVWGGSTSLWASSWDSVCRIIGWDGVTWVCDEGENVWLEVDNPGGDIVVGCEFYGRLVEEECMTIILD